jgi:hypothetical protein
VITSVATETRESLAIAKRLRDAQSEINAIKVTLEELEKLAAAARRLEAAVRSCRGRLGEDVVAPVLSQARQLADEVAASRDRFARGASRRENLPLKTIGRKLERLIKGFDEHWHLHAQAKLAPYLEFRALVVYLPEEATSEAEISQLVRQICDQMKEAPRSDAELTRFDHRLADLGLRLEGVANLPNEVRAFLTKVASGGATLKDLTPTVADWIEEGQRAGAFAISFASRRSAP